MFINDNTSYLCVVSVMGGIKVIRGGYLIDGTGREPLEDVVVVIKGREICEVSKEGTIEIPSSAEVIDASGMTVMPGLIDCHVHLSGSRSVNPFERLRVPRYLRILRASVDARKLIEAGFTTIRDVGSEFGPALRDAIAEGTIVGPRILAAGKPISQTFGHGDWHYLPYHWVKEFAILADGPYECRKAVRLVLRDGVDLIKICTSGGVFSEKDEPAWPQFTLEEIEAIVDEAHRVGRRVAAHAEGWEGIKNAILGGVDTVEHGDQIDEELIELIKEKGKILVPTMAIDDAMVKHGEKAGIPTWAMRKIRELRSVNIRNYQKAYKAGVRMAIGTDYGGPEIFPMGGNAVELELRVKLLGAKEMDVILQATKIAAEALGLEDKIGTLEKGKLADVIVVNGNPLKDITVLRDVSNIRIVMKEGSIVVNRGISKA